MRAMDAWMLQVWAYRLVCLCVCIHACMISAYLAYTCTEILTFQHQNRLPKDAHDVHIYIHSYIHTYIHAYRLLKDAHDVHILYTHTYIHTYTYLHPNTTHQHTKNRPPKDTYARQAPT